MLGDTIHNTLSKAGITPERYRSLKVMLKMKDGCDCEECRELLNELHEHWQDHGLASAIRHAREIRRRIYHPIKVD